MKELINLITNNQNIQIIFLAMGFFILMLIFLLFHYCKILKLYKEDYEYFKKEYFIELGYNKWYEKIFFEILLDSDILKLSDEQKDKLKNEIKIREDIKE